MRGVITMNEEYETRFLCNSSKVRRRGPWAELGPGARLPPHSEPGRAGGRWGRGWVDDLASVTGDPGFFASSKPK